MVAELAKHCRCLMYYLEHKNNKLFNGLVMKLVEEAGQTKLSFYEKSNLMRNICAGVRGSCL